VRVVSFTPKNNFLTRTKLGYKVSTGLMFLQIIPVVKIEW